MRTELTQGCPCPEKQTALCNISFLLEDFCSCVISVVQYRHSGSISVLYYGFYSIELVSPTSLGSLVALKDAFCLFVLDLPFPLEFSFLWIFKEVF